MVNVAKIVQMKRWLLLLCSLGVASPVWAAGFDPFAGPKPLAVLIESNPWANVVGADTPQIAVYDDGRVIFLQGSGPKAAYRVATLDRVTFAGVKKRFRAVSGLKTLRKSYSLTPNLTDQPATKIYLREGKREVVTQVSGLSADGQGAGAGTDLSGGLKPDKLPPELAELYRWLSRAQFSRSQKWQPKYVEVMLWDYSNAPEKSARWPKNWPSLRSKRAIKRGEDYSIFVDGKELPQITRFLAQKKQKAAVAWSGKKWAMDYRLTFPGEPMWDSAFNRAQYSD
jgi:hypothetical protein